MKTMGMTAADSSAGEMTDDNREALPSCYPARVSYRTVPLQVAFLLGLMGMKGSARPDPLPVAIAETLRCRRPIKACSGRAASHGRARPRPSAHAQRRIEIARIA